MSVNTSERVRVRGITRRRSRDVMLHRRRWGITPRNGLRPMLPALHLLLVSLELLKHVIGDLLRVPSADSALGVIIDARRRAEAAATVNADSLPQLAHVKVRIARIFPTMLSDISLARLCFNLACCPQHLHKPWQMLRSPVAGNVHNVLWHLEAEEVHDAAREPDGEDESLEACTDKCSVSAC